MDRDEYFNTPPSDFGVTSSVRTSSDPNSCTNLYTCVPLHMENQIHTRLVAILALNPNQERKQTQSSQGNFTTTRRMSGVHSSRKFHQLTLEHLLPNSARTDHKFTTRITSGDFGTPRVKLKLWSLDSPRTT